jgi:hypothetical protein
VSFLQHRRNNPLVIITVCGAASQLARARLGAGHEGSRHGWALSALLVARLARDPGVQPIG